MAPNHSLILGTEEDGMQHSLCTWHMPSEQMVLRYILIIG